jgi:hypothetical protein
MDDGDHAVVDNLDIRVTGVMTSVEPFHYELGEHRKEALTDNLFTDVRGSWLAVVDSAYKSGSAATPINLVFTADKPVVVYMSRLWARPGFKTQAPDSWTLFGANDKYAEWTKLDSQEDVGAWSAVTSGGTAAEKIHEARTDIFQNAAAFKFYRLSITKCGNNPWTQVSLSQWALYERPLHAHIPYDPACAGPNGNGDPDPLERRGASCAFLVEFESIGCVELVKGHDEICGTYCGVCNDISDTLAIESGASCDLTCDIGYTLSDQPKCTAGTLSSTTAVCSPDPCNISHVEKPSNGYFGTICSGAEGLIESGASCDLTCDTGYTLSDQPTCTVGTLSLTTAVCSPDPCNISHVEEPSNGHFGTICSRAEG